MDLTPEQRMEALSSWIGGTALTSAYQEGLPSALLYLENKLKQAVTEGNADGVHETVNYLLKYYAISDEPARAIELARRYTDLTSDSAQMLRFIGRHAYFELHETTLALKYLEKAEACVDVDLRKGGMSVAGIHVREFVAIKRLELLILTDANLEPERARKALGELTLQAGLSVVRDDNFLHALPLLVSRGIATKHHISLIEHERANLKPDPPHRRVSRRKIQVITEALNQLRGEYPEDSTSGTDPV
jgi:hypothetical protein